MGKLLRHRRRGRSCPDRPAVRRPDADRRKTATERAGGRRRVRYADDRPFQHRVAHRGGSARSLARRRRRVYALGARGLERRGVHGPRGAARPAAEVVPARSPGLALSFPLSLSPPPRSPPLTPPPPRPPP